MYMYMYRVHTCIIHVHVPMLDSMGGGRPCSGAVGSNDGRSSEVRPGVLVVFSCCFGSEDDRVVVSPLVCFWVTVFLPEYCLV